MTAQPYPLLSVDDLANLPQPSWLVDGILPAREFSVLFGPSGGGKSFVALDWSLCVATGAAWFGQRAEPGWVLYIAAEGSGGLHQRVAAWEQARDRQADRIRFLADAVNLLDGPALQRAQATVAAMPEPPALIVIDTLARTMVGGDENAAKDVGRFIHSVDELRASVGAAALVVHHTGRNGEDERGSTALRGAANTMYALRPDDSGLRLESEKAKDAEKFAPWRLHLEPRDESCVIACGTDRTGLGPTERQVLESVSASFGTDPASTSAIRDASEVARSSFFRALKSLSDAGFLTRTGEGRATRYTLTDAGTLALVPKVSDGLNGGSPGRSQVPPPFIGVGPMGPNGNPGPTDVPRGPHGEELFA